MFLSSQKLPYIQSYLFKSNGKIVRTPRNTLTKETGGEGPSFKERVGKMPLRLL